MYDHLAEVDGKSTKKHCNLMQKTEDIYHFLLKNIGAVRKPGCNPSSRFQGSVRKTVAGNGVSSCAPNVYCTITNRTT